MTQPTFSTYGAVDLGALAARNSQRAAPAAAVATGEGAGYVVDVTEAEFADVVIQQSMTVPVLIDFWATWCNPCRQLSPILEKLAAEGAGRWLLAKVDSDAEQRLAAAFQVQSIPSVFAVIGGRPLPLFQGALPEAQVRTYLEEVLRIAEANGVTGRLAAAPVVAEPAGEPVEEQPAADPRFDAAYAAADRGDFAAAATEFRTLLAETPADTEAQEGLAQVELLARVAAFDDPEAVLARATADPDDLGAGLDAADLEFATGSPELAFARLLDAVRRGAGSGREAARARILEYFVLLGPDDPRVPENRRALARALF